MTLIMQECGGQLKKAEDVNKLEEEFNNLAFFYLWGIKIINKNKIFIYIIISNVIYI